MRTTKTHWPARLIVQAVALLEEGMTEEEVAEETGIPPATLRNYRRGRLPRRAVRALSSTGTCDGCLEAVHDLGDLPTDQYAYVLGAYLGDGTVFRQGRNKTSFALRITLDQSYPWIIISICDAIEDIIGRRPAVRPDKRSACVHVLSYAKEWGCLLPQHGPGRKHERKIELEDWQQAIVDRAPQAFLRGLIHTDGWRGLNKVRVKGRDYAYPRYQFSNRSDDIRKLFTDTCDYLGIRWRKWGRWHISVARKPDVAQMDSSIGPKC